MPKSQISTVIDPQVKEMLERMASDDLRKLRGQLEWLIIEEHKRRQQPRVLVDESGRYEYRKESANG